MEQPYPALSLALEPYNLAFNILAGHSWRTEVLPQGDGHPVLVYPGFGVSGAATTELRVRLRQLRYQVYDWELGIGLWPYSSLDPWLLPMARQLQQIRRAHDRQVSLVGWSLGGIYARELAKRHPGDVRQVITMGTPLAIGSGTHPLLLAMTTHGAIGEAADMTWLEQLRQPPPVRCTSIYSRADGIVDWKSCIDPHLPEPRNIEVAGVSHFGMVHHPGVLETVAHLLAE